MPGWAVLLFSGMVLSSPVSVPSEAPAFLLRNPSPPDYLLQSLERHRIVILGEAHWLAHEVALVREMIPRLAERRVLLGIEMLPASEQAGIDALITAEQFDEKAAIGILRAASWPYADYLEILRTTWSVNRGQGPRARVVALGPPDDWRQTLLPQGKTYESFMADLVTAALSASDTRMLVYCGLHHGFTRYEQPEVRDDGFAHRFMDRMGNILRRHHGQDAFLVMLHRPIWCGDPKSWKYCLPFDGVVDCAAVKDGRPVGFDVAGSPFADLVFAPSIYYAHGYPTLRFAEFVDGYIWTRPIESYAGVGLLSLEVYAPAADAKTEASWASERARLADTVRSRGWGALAEGWRGRCP